MGKRSIVESPVCFLGPSVLITGGSVRHGKRESQVTSVYAGSKSERLQFMPDQNQRGNVERSLMLLH